MLLQVLQRFVKFSIRSLLQIDWFINERATIFFMLWKAILFKYKHYTSVTTLNWPYILVK